jgi:hypothetical protein
MVHVVKGFLEEASLELADPLGNTEAAATFSILIYNY